MIRYSAVANFIVVIIAALFTGAAVFGQGVSGDHWTIQPYKILKGTISRKNYQSYVEVPFVLPKSEKRLTMEFSYSKENRTTIDLGLTDPQGFRGWSGGARNRFTISKEDATPGYFPGPLPAGKWKLL